MRWIKLGARYTMIGFVMYLAYKVTDTEYLLAVNGADSSTVNIVVGAIFGALTLIVNGHMYTKISKS